MKIAEKITAAIVLILITAVSAVTVFTGRSKISLQKYDRKSVGDGLFTESLIKETAENFAWNGIWRSLAAEISSGTAEPIVNNVYIADDRLLSTVQFSDENTQQIASYINGYAEKYSGAVYLASVPTSSGIYGDILPSHVLTVKEKQIFDGFYDTLSANIRKIDAYTILKMLSDNYIYYRTDTKWTSYGAYCVYRTVIQKLGFIPVSYDKYTVRHITDEYRGNLFDKTNYMESKADILDIYEYDDGTEITEYTVSDRSGLKANADFYDISAAEGNDKYSLYPGGKVPLAVIKTSVNNDRKLLVIGDEYADCFLPFLTKHYSEIAFVSIECLDESIYNYADIEEYEQTLFLFGTESFSNGKFENLG